MESALEIGECVGANQLLSVHYLPMLRLGGVLVNFFRR
jgi:hypothetical protein